MQGTAPTELTAPRAVWKTDNIMKEILVRVTNYNSFLKKELFSLPASSPCGMSW